MGFERFRRRRKLGYENKIVFLALLAVLPWCFLAMLLVRYDLPRDGLLITVLICMVATAITLRTLRFQLGYPLRTLSNLIASIRKEDYSFRARGARKDDALGEVLVEINELAATLREQRLGAREATALVQRVINELDSAIFAFNGDRRLRLVNRAGASLLERPADELAGRSSEELGLADLLDMENPTTIGRTFPGATGRWSVHRSTFRDTGLRHNLLVITDVSRALREEERQAWQRLLRVIGHELNNSLTPIMSIASSLETAAARDPVPDDFQNDLRRGLEIISSRAEGLRRFMEAYSRLARLPKPRLAPVAIPSMVQRTAALEQRKPVKVEGGPEIAIDADAAQVEQALINLVRNAVDAASETDGAVSIRWSLSKSSVEIEVLDEGPGVSGRTNLFVPFFTTKPGGTGIGLVLSRQIAEGHGGMLTLEDRQDRQGSVARLTLPR